MINDHYQNRFFIKDKQPVFSVFKNYAIFFLLPKLLALLIIKK